MSERIWKGQDVVLYSASQYGWSPFRDFFVLGMNDKEINDFVRNAIGIEEWTSVLLKSEEEDEKSWEVAYESYANREAIDKAVVDEYIENYMQDFDTYYYVEKIIEEEAYWRKERESM